MMHTAGAEITLIHAMRSSLDPTEQAFAELWPEATRRSILVDGLANELAARGRIDAQLTARFRALGRYAMLARPQAILFSCSAFGPCVEAVREDLAPVPVRKPTDALLAELAKSGGRVGLVAWFAPTLASLMPECPANVAFVPIFVEGAAVAHAAGDWIAHDRLVVEAALSVNVDTYALAQFSIARAAPALRARTSKRVVTSPDCAVLELKHALSHL
jgi:hypothetical protein